MSSGGGKASTPKLLDDNLKSKQFYRVLDLISEGPIYGPVDQSHLSSFMLNKTPITDSAGNVSVNGVSVAWRPGSEFQDPINGFSAIEATSIVNTEVTFNTPLVRTITDQDVTRVRLNIGVTGLVEQDTKGNQKNTSATMVIETRVAGGAFTLQKTVTIGPNKISGEYLEAHVIEAPATKPFDIRVRRITPDSNSDLLSNGTIWNSYSQITDDNLNYPFSAIAGSVIDRDQYRDTPSRTYHLRGLIVDVPDNYDPIARTYSGLWTGGFKKAWTNNPAWLFRELVKNTRFGLARRAGYIDVDDGALYILSQYCDQPVNDGYGGKEPRMTLNAYITEQASARDILDKIAGMFRGIALWDGLRLTVMLDTPQDPVATITNANVVDGKFSRSSVKRAEKYNAVVVSWTDPDNGWEQVKEYVSDDAMIARGNYNETTLEAFGCTSRGQAWRAGKWLLETAKRESSRLTFQMARDAIAFTPGDVVEIMDNDYAGTRLGGRIVSHSGANITVDADVSSLVSPGDNMSLMGSNGKFLKYPIMSVSGRVITLRSVPAWVRDGTVFAIAIIEISVRLFRILSIAETENNSVYSITAAQHDPNKQVIVDEGAVFEMPTDTLNGYRVPNIENLRILNTNSETVQVTATWETATTTKKLVFELYVYNESGAVVAQYETDQFRYEFYGLNAGGYTLGVRGRNENGMKGAETQVSMIIGAPRPPNSVQWIPGPLQATLVPVMSVTATTDTSFEFWYAGEAPVTGDIENLTQFLGRGHQWTIQRLKFDHTYYMYVRTRNAFGVSAFIEVSGKPTDDFSDITDAILEDMKQTDLFKDVVESAIDSSAKIAGIVADVQQNADDLEQQALAIQQNTDGLAAAAVKIDETAATLDGMTAGVKNSSIAVIQSSLAQVNSRRRQTATNAANSATIDRVDMTIATNEQATATALLQLQTKSDSNTATINALSQTVTSYQQSTATQITSLTVTVNGFSSAVTTNAQAVADIKGNLNAMYSIKVAVDSNGVQYAAGMGLGVQNTPSGMQSQVIFLADRFAVMSQAGAAVTLPFVIQNGQTFIRDTFIQDGTISNTKIGNYIQSADWDGTGNVGWHINKSGFATLNNVTVRGNLYATSGNFSFNGANNTVVIDGNGVTVNLPGGGMIRLGMW
ncbi:host specificity protein J [Atlantibacter subterraneus]|uniref:host specificity protein J n=1 Tax=Atlantibacter subterraneus TaxID=255519 RepID=UPI002964B790|nr:phage tail protein [Atlantibacter subterranea]MDW2743332.1 phage tail protein [Atlantibacter subterranea]